MLNLVIANKNYSSWSLRPWLALTQGGIPFEETLVLLDQPDTRDAIRRHSESGQLPVLHDGALTVWDSLAIIEYVAETFPEAKLWPDAPSARAVARSVCAEMHSGFLALRSEFSMRFRERYAARPLSEGVRKDVTRIITLWGDCRERFGDEGPFLFGSFGAADCVYAPVVSRFLTYAVPLPPDAQNYVDTIVSLPAWKSWANAAKAEPALMSH